MRDAIPKVVKISVTIFVRSIQNVKSNMDSFQDYQQDSNPYNTRNPKSDDGVVEAEFRVVKEKE